MVCLCVITGMEFMKYENQCKLCDALIEEDTDTHCSTVSHYQNYVAWIKKVNYPLISAVAV